MIVKLIALAWNVVWYIQCLWHVVECIEDCKDCVEEGFQWARGKVDRCGQVGECI